MEGCIKLVVTTLLWLCADATLLYVCPESHIGLGRVFPDAYTSSGELMVSTSPEVGRLVHLQPSEIVLEVLS